LEIIPKIIKEISVQNYPQNARYNTFQIFSLVLKNNTSIIKSAPLEYITAFIHSMDGEKDPRNLLLLFQIALFIIKNLDFSAKCQDLFEVVYCYFPITFRPPQNDIYRITADDLKEALRNVASSTSLFSTFAIPVLIEKLSSSSPSAKSDAIETISACLPTYTAQPFIPHLNELLKTIKSEIVRRGVGNTRCPECEQQDE
jgi:DNA repair/transcription protein MET18/MMS19